MQKIKNVFVDENGNRKHLLPKHRIPQAPPAPAAPLAARSVETAPLTSSHLMAQKATLSAVDTNMTRGSLVQEAAFAQPAMVQPASTVLTREATVLETIEKPVVVQERIHPIEKEEIQQIIYREREQLDVRQITQMLHETEIKPTLFEQRELPAERREAIVERAAPIEENVVLATREVNATKRTSVILEPIINEVIKKTVIEEVQPVLELDIIAPTVILNTQPIHEKVVEAPTVYREVRQVKELGTRYVELNHEHYNKDVHMNLGANSPMSGKLHNTAVPVSF